MKRLLSLILTLTLLFTLFACGKIAEEYDDYVGKKAEEKDEDNEETTGGTTAPTVDETEPTDDGEKTPTEPAEEAGVLKVLTIGHSLTVDACHMLNLVAAAEGMGEVIIGTLYYSGCPLNKHVQFLTNDEPAYHLYTSSTTTPNMIPTIEEGVTMEYALSYDYWDIIVMQGGVFEVAKSATYTNGDIQKIQEYVNKHKLADWATFAWHMPWVFPVDRDLQLTKDNDSYHMNYEEFDQDRSKLYGAMTKCVGDHIVTDETFDFLIPSGTAIENALSSYMTEKDLHRDYAHASDFGRLIASYTWYCKLAGLEKLDAVKLDKVPKQFFKSTPAGSPDWVLTDHEKELIIESVNNALKNPLQVTQSQFTENPEAVPQRVVYKVTVVDSLGQPISGTMVQLTSDVCIPAITDATGTATWTVTEDDYKVSFLALPNGYTADMTEYYFAAGSYAMTIVLKSVEPDDGIMTYAEFMAAEISEECTIEFFVQDTQGWWFDSYSNIGKVTIYGQTEEGGYFAYDAICDEETGKKVVPGTKVRISGAKMIFNGLHEIVNGTLEIVEATPWTAPVLDITSQLASDKLFDHVGKKIAIKGATVVAADDADAAFLYNWDGSGSEGNDLYFYVQVGDAVQQLVIESYLCGVGSEAYEAVRGLQVGDRIDMEGYLYWYEGALPHVYKVDVLV